MSLRDRFSRFGLNRTSEFIQGDLWAGLFRLTEELAPHVVDDLRTRSPEAWADHWFGGSRQAVRQARRTRDLWLESPKLDKEGKFGVFPVGMQGVLEASTRSFEYVEWNPQMESRAKAKARILGELEQQLDAEMEAKDPEHAWGQIRIPKQLERDLRWFVDYQYLEKVPAAIALQSEADPDSAVRTVSSDQVDRAIRRMSGKLGISRRIGNRRGRPPKSSRE